MAAALLNHSWFSLLEGVSSIPSLLGRAAALGYRSFALTDSNNLLGVIPFVKNAKALGMKPLVGAHLSFDQHQCVALVENCKGYRNLCSFLSQLHLGKGHDACELLVQKSEGIHLVVGNPLLLSKLHGMFMGRIWAGLDRSRGTRLNRRHRELLELAQKLDVKPLALHACYFASALDYKTYHLVSALRQSCLLERVQAGRVGVENHLPDPEMVKQRFQDLPEAWLNTCNFPNLLADDVIPNEMVLPSPLESCGMHASEHLRKLCESGLHRRGIGRKKDVKTRMEEELRVIGKRGLDGYFLTVREIVGIANQRNYSMALRGSAGNSLVCYLLGITNVDPLYHGLAFERFLHDGRIDLPDIDLDFDWKVRDALIDEVIRRRGSQYCARISSHLYLQPKSAFRESARVHGLSDTQISLLGPQMEVRLEEFVGSTKVPRMESTFKSPIPKMQLQAVLRDAGRLSGRPHHLSIHPGGIVITPRPIEEYVPLQWSAKGVVVTQFEKDAIEEIGLVKIDLLGNRALANVDEAMRTAGLSGEDINIFPKDHETAGLVSRGDTLGVNQMESPGMRHLLIQMQASGLNDVIQSLALIRPGAASIGMKERFIRRRRKLEPVPEFHDAIAGVLGDNEFMLLYEDDCQKLMQAIAGMDARQADLFRKKVSKSKSSEDLASLKDEFFTRCHGRGLPEKLLHDLWLQVSKFNRYSFCKSHAVSYGLIAWKAAWFKAHHPRAFWIAALNNNQGMYPQWVYLEAIRAAGIDLLSPCVNRSVSGFSVENDRLRVGLRFVRGLSESFLVDLLEDRRLGGAYASLPDLVMRLNPSEEGLWALISSGACDVFGLSRQQLFLQCHAGIGRLGGELFGTFGGHGWKSSSQNPRQQSLDEWMTMGFSVSQPLFWVLAPEMIPERVVSVEMEHRKGQEITVAGLVATSRRTTTESGEFMQFITLVDEKGMCDLVLFPSICKVLPHVGIGPYKARGIVEEHHGVLVLKVNRIMDMRKNNRPTEVLDIQENYS